MHTPQKKLKDNEEICNNHDNCHTEMPKWVEILLKYSPGQKSLEVLFAIYLDLECFLKKEKSSENNLEKSYTEKKTKHEPSGWAIFTKCSFDEKKLDYCRRKDCIKKLCKKLKKHSMKTINYEKKKEIIPLTSEENNSYKEQEACHICKEKFCTDKDDENNKNKRKVKDHRHYTGKFRGAAHSKCNINF